jgi:sugar-specific transcriptional regulator TrmB
MKEPIETLLADIGFNGLEASVYVALLREPGSTGYRVAQMVGKPVANTYKALDALRVKGAVVVDESSNVRTYAALPIHEYVDGLRHSLELKRDALEASLQGMAPAEMHGGIFRLTTVDQVYDRARSLIRSAKSVILADVFPHPLERLRPDFVAAARRGVKVVIKAYAPTRCTECELVAPEKPSNQVEVWNGDWLNLFIDCGEFLQSFLKRNDAGVQEAVWSRNPYLGFLSYGGFAHELLLTRVALMLGAGAESKAITKELQRMSQRYFDDSCVFTSIPDAWKGPWLKERDKKARKAETK